MKPGEYITLGMNNLTPLDEGKEYVFDIVRKDKIVGTVTAIYEVGRLRITEILSKVKA